MHFALTLNQERYQLISEGTSRSTLLMLHGFTGTGGTWAAAAPALADDHALLLPDLLGHGATAAPPQPNRYSMSAAAGDLRAMLDALRLPRVHLLGYSMGGRLALYFATQQPQRVATLTLVSASPGLEDAAQRAERRAHDEALADRIERDGVTAFVTDWEALPLWDTQARTMDADARAALRAERLSQRPQGLANSLRGMGTGVQPSLWQDLPALALPTLLLVGEHDARFRAINERMHAALPDSRLHVLPGVGHALHLEAPDAFAQVVRDFLASHPLERGS